MSSSGKRSKGKSTKARKQVNKIEDVEVGVGLLDITTFDSYKIQGDRQVYGVIEELSEKIVDSVYQRYGLERPPDDAEDADCWVFPSDADYARPLYDLPAPADDTPKLMVVVKLQSQTPMLTRSLGINKENLKDGQLEGPQLSASARILAELTLMRKDLDANKEEISSLKVSNEQLKISNEQLKISNEQLKKALKDSDTAHNAEIHSLKVSNEKLKNALKDSDAAHNAEIHSLKVSNEKLRDELLSLKAQLKTRDDQHKADVLSLMATNDKHEARIAHLESKIASLRTENGELKSRLADVTRELAHYTHMITPLYIRILLDKARKKVLLRTSYKKWLDYYCRFSNHAACTADVVQLTNLDPDLAEFISNPKSRLRKDGNKAAHHAARSELEGAVGRTTINRRLVELAFDYVYPPEEQDDQEEEGNDNGEDDYYDDDDDEEEVEEGVAAEPNTV